MNFYQCSNILVPLIPFFVFSYNSNFPPCNSKFSYSTTSPILAIFLESRFLGVRRSHIYTEQQLCLYIFLPYDFFKLHPFNLNFLSVKSNSHPFINFLLAWHDINKQLSIHGRGNKLFQLWPMVSRQASSHDSSFFLSEEIRFQG